MKLVVVDLETYYATDYSLSKKSITTESYIRDERFKVHGAGIKVGNGPSRWVTGSKLPALFAAMPWHEIALIGHNLQFDATILAWHYGVVPKLYIDTLGMSRALVGQHSKRHGLHYISPIITGANGGRALHKMDGLAQAMNIRDLPSFREQILADYTVKPPHYNPNKMQWEAGDAELTWEIFKVMAPHFPTKELRVLDWTIRKFAEPKLFLDDELLTEYLQFVLDMKEVALQRAGLESRDLLMSNPRYAAALEALGVVVPTKFNAKGKIAFAFAKTDHDHKALLEHDNPEVQALVAARLQVKSTIEETRTKLYLDASVRGAWPVAYSYSGAVNTHRFSGNRGGGGNPMNLKRGGTLRDCIYAPYGKTLLVLDLSQIECRLTLWFGMLSKKSKGMELESLELMRNGGDLYSYFAGMMFGRVIDKKESPNERQVGKSAVLGLGFGMGPARFMDYAITMGAKGVDAKLAETTVHLYRNTYTGVRAIWRTFEQAFKAAVATVAREKEILETTGEVVDLSAEFWSIGPIKIVRDPLFGSLSMQTHGGLLIKYPQIGWDAENQGTYRDGGDGGHDVNIFGGKITENVAQHTARNILIDHLLEINPRYEVVMSTYDELVCLVDDNEAAIAEAVEFCVEVMTREHPMYPGLPLGVEWGTATRYGQAKN